MNQENPLLSFMHPPTWIPSRILTGDVWSADAGVRLDAPDGRAALEVFIDMPSLYASSSQMTLGEVAAAALLQVLKDPTYQVLCSSNATHPMMASMGKQDLFVAVASASHFAVVKASSVSIYGQAPYFTYVVYAGPKGEFEHLTHHVFGPVLNSFPKGGGGGCPTDDPDTDGDGTCDSDDNYPNDPNRQ